MMSNSDARKRQAEREQVTYSAENDAGALYCPHDPECGDVCPAPVPDNCLCLGPNVCSTCDDTTHVTPPGGSS